MIKIIKIGLLHILLMTGLPEMYAQSFNMGFVFQYHILKQIEVNSPTVTGTYSHNIFNVKENNWKIFAGGQSIVVGMMGQLDYKKFYLTTELSYNLNTYRYALFYTLAPGEEEKIVFETLYFQVEVPLYLGYQFQSTNLVRYSVFGGALVTIPWNIQTSLEGNDETINDRYDTNDMRYILYDDKPYLNSIFGFGVHIASLAKIDLRYIHRFSPPGNTYGVQFNTVGIAVTYYLSLNLKKKKFFYEE